MNCDVLSIENVGGHYAAFVPNAAGSSFRFHFVARRANDDDVIALPDFTLHKLGQLIARHPMPVVQTGVDAVLN
jgi:hypothetical protein